MLLDRPIAFTLDDVEEYRQSRGFVFENIQDWLPGMELLSFEDMCLFIKEVGEGIDTTKEKRKTLIKKMHMGFRLAPPHGLLRHLFPLYSAGEIGGQGVFHLL